MVLSVLTKGLRSADATTEGVSIDRPGLAVAIVGRLRLD
jgi:hypothetical protein